MMDIQEFKGRLKKIAAHKQYRISSKDREAAKIALDILRELEKSQPLVTEHFEKTENMSCSTGRQHGIPEW